MKRILLSTLLTFTMVSSAFMAAVKAVEIPDGAICEKAGQKGFYICFAPTDERALKGGVGLNTVKGLAKTAKKAKNLAKRKRSLASKKRFGFDRDYANELAAADNDDEHKVYGSDADYGVDYTPETEEPDYGDDYLSYETDYDDQY